MQNFNKDLLSNHGLNKTYSSGRSFDYNYRNIFTNNTSGNNIKSEIGLIYNNISNLTYKIENLTYKIENLTYKIENIDKKLEDFSYRIQNVEKKIEKCNLDMQKMGSDLEERLNNRINQKFYQLNIYGQSSYNEFINKYNILTSEIQRIDSDLAIISFNLMLDTELSQFTLNKKSVNKNEKRENVKSANVKRENVKNANVKNVNINRENIRGFVVPKMKTRENI